MEKCVWAIFLETVWNVDHFKFLKHIFSLLRNEWSHTLKGRRWSEQRETVLKMARTRAETSVGVSLLHCAMGFKEAMASRSVPWSLCTELGRGVSQEQPTENMFIGWENLQASFHHWHPSLPNPIMAVFATYMLSLDFLFSCLICQTRKFNISERTMSICTIICHL